MAIESALGSGIRSTLKYEVIHSSSGTEIVVGQLPPGTTGSQIIVEVSSSKLLEVSLDGGSGAHLSYQLPHDVRDEHLQVKFSRKKQTLKISWAASEQQKSEQDADQRSASREKGNAGPGSVQKTQHKGMPGLDEPGDSSVDTHEAVGNNKMLSSTETSNANAGSTAHLQDAETHATTSGESTSKIEGGQTAQSPKTTRQVAPQAPQPNAAFCDGRPGPSRPISNKKSKKKKGKNKLAGERTSSGSVHGLEDLEATADKLAEQLLSRGVAFVDEFLSPDVVRSILAETAPLQEYFEPGEIWVGKEAQAGAQVARDDVRGDSILWMNFPTMISNNCRTLHRAMRRMDTLVMNLLPRRVPRLANVSEHSDAMLSRYPPPGARFQKHIDNTARDGRCLTVLLYLNADWKPEWGGSLKLWPLKTGHIQGSLVTTAAQTLSRGGGLEPVELLPITGRLAMFYSDRVLHEVLPTRSMRYAVTQWYYDRNERAEALAAAKAAAGGGTKHALKGASSVESQAEAHGFIRALMVDNSDPTPELLCSLTKQVENLSPAALEMASEIMGASTPQDLVQAVRDFTPQSLTELREELTRMGQ